MYGEVVFYAPEEVSMDVSDTSLTVKVGGHWANWWEPRVTTAAFP